MSRPRKETIEVRTELFERKIIELHRMRASAHQAHREIRALLNLRKQDDAKFTALEQLNQATAKDAQSLLEMIDRIIARCAPGIFIESQSNRPAALEAVFRWISGLETGLVAAQRAAEGALKRADETVTHVRAQLDDLAAITAIVARGESGLSLGAVHIDKPATPLARRVLRAINLRGTFCDKHAAAAVNGRRQNKKPPRASDPAVTIQGKSYGVVVPGNTPLSVQQTLRTMIEKLDAAHAENQRLVGKLEAWEVIPGPLPEATRPKGGDSEQGDLSGPVRRDDAQRPTLAEMNHSMREAVAATNARRDSRGAEV